MRITTETMLVKERGRGLTSLTLLDYPLFAEPA
jgi:hypothetical protein